MHLSAAETNRALLSFNFRLQAASLRVASSGTQNTEIEGGSDVERAGNVWLQLQFSDDPVKPILIVCICACVCVCVCICACVCSDTFYIQILTK